VFISDKQVGNYKLFSGQEDIKRIMRDIRYNSDDILVRLSRIKCYVFSDLEMVSNEH